MLNIALLKKLKIARKNFTLFLQEVNFKINYTCYNDQHKLLNIWNKA